MKRSFSLRGITAVTFLLPAVIAGTVHAEDRPQTNEWVQYKKVEGRDFDASVGIRYKRAPDGGIIVETASVATGRGSGFRDWEVTDTKLLAGSSRVRPVSYDKIYVSSESVFAKPATAVFTAIGAAYGVYADECSDGGTCPVTGAPSGEKRQRSGLAKGIDTAGMAAGLGLLTSRAKGEITGQKAVFNLTSDEAESLSKVNLTAEQEGSGRKKRIKIDIGDLPEALFADYIKKHPGVQHSGGVKKGGTFVTVGGEAAPELPAEDPEQEEGAGTEGKEKKVKDKVDAEDLKLPYTKGSEAPPVRYVEPGGTGKKATPEKRPRQTLSGKELNETRQYLEGPSRGPARTIEGSGILHGMEVREDETEERIPEKGEGVTTE
ncbi:MAG: hypothetical protein GF408_02970 [Candidatus Omnitrophica bacterium]|nr:hypothetical protein [Candidatus Omnitrophota bacterium]